ncbi:unnamed protein product [Paramecium pentaurelia]|uniref:CCHC-type domain-containing protein n=1 Tax=Paramecium pentaurelia TaxID=43138 RepID=A0A8S1U0T8_9CILI|nr:unnamed protein product [Paramecium pentaurelia]
MIQIYLDSNPIEKISNDEDGKQQINNNSKTENGNDLVQNNDATNGIVKNIIIKPIQIYQSNSKRTSKSYSNYSQSDSSSSSSSNSKSLQSITCPSKEKQQHDKNKTKMLDFVLDSHPSKKDIQIRYQVDGKQRTISNKLINYKLSKIINQKQENQEEKKEDTIKDQTDFQQNLKQELEIGVNRYYQKNCFNLCFRCKQVGHLENQCTEKQRIQCIYCLSQKHHGDCCNNISCFRCNRNGHRKYDCKIKLKLTFCPYCGKTSHKAEDCGIIVPVQTKGNNQIICLVCKQYGHANCNIDSFQL